MNTSLVCLKKLRYQPLPYLLGRKITIPRITGTEAAVLRALETTFTARCTLQDSVRQMALVLTKYGFLDLTFQVPLQLLSRQDQPHRSTLKELSFIAQEPSGGEEDRSCLETLMEGIQEDKCWLRLFLFAEPATDTLKRLLEHYHKDAELMRPTASVESTVFRMEKIVSRMADAIDQRLPMTFTVQDACLTNSDCIWLAKHGYL